MALLRYLRLLTATTMTLIALTVAASTAVVADPAASTSSSVDMRLPDSPHADALMEWWYANAHITTNAGKHLAVVCAFFKIGTEGAPPMMGMPAMRPGHYLIYAVTDLGTGTQRAYSFADAPMVGGLKTLLMFTGGRDPQSASLLNILLKGKLPEPHQFIRGPVGIADSPLLVHYGDAGSFAAIDGVNSYRLRLGGKDTIDFTFKSEKPVMKVGGKGETGLVKPTDMYYYSLTRCDVTGNVNGAAVKTGQGWIDHQWGASWTTQKAGWDWWGAQLDDGTDILFFQQRNLTTGKTFFPLATFMDKDGVQTVTRNIVFRPVPGASWRSPRTKSKYPLAWDVSFPDQNLNLRITADVKAQEMPVLTPGGDIWEGSCSVIGLSSMGTRMNPGESGMPIHSRGYIVKGTAYMELVGYSRARKQGR